MIGAPGYCWQCDAEVLHGRFCGDCHCARAHYNGRAAAAYVVSRAVRAGILLPARTFTCTDCGAPARDYDHRDYSKPLEVEPVCRRCNGLRGPGKWTQFKPLRVLIAERRANG